MPQPEFSANAVREALNLPPLAADRPVAAAEVIEWVSDLADSHLDDPPRTFPQPVKRVKGRRYFPGNAVRLYLGLEPFPVDRLATAPEVREWAGGVSDMTLWRWLNPPERIASPTPDNTPEDLANGIGRLAARLLDPTSYA